MSSSKEFMQSQLRKWKSAASQLISTEGEAVETAAIELEPEVYDKCRRMAEAEQTTVSAVVHYMIDQYFAVRSHEMTFQATMEQKEKNPLLQLDSLTKRKERYTGEEVQSYDRA